MSEATLETARHVAAVPVRTEPRVQPAPEHRGPDTPPRVVPEFSIGDLMGCFVVPPHIRAMGRA